MTAIVIDPPPMSREDWRKVELAGQSGKTLTLNPFDGEGLVHGKSVSLADCERMQAQRLGFEPNLAVWDEPPRFEVTMSYLDAALPESKLGHFLVVNDDGYPFLLGCTPTSWGMDVRYNSYINPLLERDLRGIVAVDVVEIAGEEKRTYQVPLRHCFE